MARVDPRAASRYERQLEDYAAAHQQAAYQQHHNAQVSTWEEMRQNVAAQYSDFESLEPQMAEIAAQNPELLSHLHSPSPQVKTRVLESLCVMARDGVTADVAMAQVANSAPGSLKPKRDPMVERALRAMEDM